MRHLIQFFCIALLTIHFTSCRDDSDTVASYAEYDIYNYGPEASLSYEGQFKAFWTAMNCNYPMWDYEREFGVDWDNVYDVYSTKFRNINDSLTDDEFESIYREILSPLHDGHFCAVIENISTQKRILINPAEIRNKENAQTRRSDIDDPETDLHYYLSEEAGSNRIVEQLDVIGKQNYIFYTDSTHYNYSLFKDNIAYFKLTAFNLSDFNKKAGWIDKQENYDSVVNVCDTWFSRVKELHNQNQLKGVIIDVRNNGGGYADDYKYVLGSLQKPDLNGRYKIGFVRAKNGIGRLDYSIKIFYSAPILNDYCEVTEPIVILANANSVSAAEMTCLGAKKMPNGRVIGKRTWGALSYLSEGSYSHNYAGIIGDMFEGPFYLYIPSVTFFSLEEEILEGKGVTPDIDVALDINLYKTTGRDTQLERALDFIRTGE